MGSAASRQSLRIQLLGTFQVAVGGSNVEDARWERRGAKLLLKLLALRPGHQIHRDQAMELIWPEQSPDAAANNLNKLIHRARHALEPKLKSGSASRFILRHGDLIVLTAPGELEIDVDAFEASAAHAIKRDSIREYETALNLYRGDLLDEDQYEDWLQPRRDQLKAQRQDLMLRFAQACQREQRSDDGIDCLNKLLADAPTNEAAHRQLMSLYAAGGQRQQALAQYHRCRDILDAELGSLPDRATTSLYEAIASDQYQPTEPRARTKQDVDARVDSVAVLPFGNTGGDPGLEYLSDGIAESLINKLAPLPGLRVLARSTVFRYRDQSTDPQGAGQQLGVRAVVVGRVAYVGDRLVIAAELVEVVDGTLLWGDQYNRLATDILAVQEDISGKIAENLRLKLTGTDRARLHKRHTESAAAYRLYLKGRYYWNKRTSKNLETALNFFQQAVEADPAYALAYAGLADSYHLLSLYSAVEPHDAMPKAREASLRALAIEDNLAEAHTSLAHYRLAYEWDWEGAEHAFKRALSFNPNYPTAHQWYHKYLIAAGRFEEATEQIEQAKALDPLSLMINSEAAWGMYFAGRYDSAVQQLRTTLEMEDRFPVAHFILALVFLQMGRFDQAIVEARKAIELQEGVPFPWALGVLGYACARSGDLAEAQRQLTKLSELSEQHHISAHARAFIHTGLEQTGFALDSLDDAVARRDDRVIFLNVEPLFEPLRDEPRFRELIVKLGLG